MKQSIWVKTKLPKFKSLEADKKCDVLIIGGGMAGLLCAYKLHNKGVDYVLAEANRIGMGITKNTTAKVTSQHGLIYSLLTKEQGQLYLNANEAALREYREMCKNIDCNFEEKDAYTYTLTDRRLIEDEVRRVNDLGFAAEFVEETQLPFKIKGAIKFPRQAQFDPFKFINAIAQDLNIYENTFVRKIENNTAITDKGEIKAEKIIVCTHFPFINKHGSYFLKLYQHRSYVCALSGADNVQGMYIDSAKKGLSFRNSGNYLLIGGGSHRTGKKGGNWAELEETAKKYYPKAEIKYQWATQDTMSLDGIPYIGQYSKNTPDLYVAAGFNKWGMTTSMVAADILTDMVLGKRNEYESLYSPQRSILKPQLFVNGFEAAVNLLTPTVKRCPHMGCALKWNKTEQTWDCPCHGSRFTKNGDIIDNPAKESIVND